jgi:hypothetical protein
MDDISRQSGQAAPGPFGRWWRSLFDQTDEHETNVPRQRTKILPGKWPSAVAPAERSALAGRAVPPSRKQSAGRSGQ